MFYNFKANHTELCNYIIIWNHNFTSSTMYKIILLLKNFAYFFAHIVYVFLKNYS